MTTPISLKQRFSLSMNLSIAAQISLAKDSNFSENGTTELNISKRLTKLSIVSSFGVSFERILPMIPLIFVLYAFMLVSKR